MFFQDSPFYFELGNRHEINETDPTRLANQSLAQGCARPPVKLTAPLILGAAANYFCHPVSWPLSIYMDCLGDSIMLAVGQSSNYVPSVPMRVAG